MTVETGQAPAARVPKERTRMEQLFNVFVFVLFLALWVVFAWALVSNQGGLHETWRWLQGLPLPVQLVVALLTLPLYAGLWVWESTWPLMVRLVLVAGLGGWNLWMFFPRQ